LLPADGGAYRTFDKLGDPETLTRMAQYELPLRMQTSVPKLAKGGVDLRSYLLCIA